MKKSIILYLLMVSGLLFGQDSYKGFLPPRMTTAQRNAIASPPAGLMIYNTTTKCMENRNTTIWVSKCTNAGGIATLNCAGATHIGTLTARVPASGVSAIIPYTGGNGGTHNGQIVTSTGIPGLTATLSAGSFANGNGQLTYVITGTANQPGTALFAINIGGRACTLSVTIQPNQTQPNFGPCTVHGVYFPHPVDPNWYQVCVRNWNNSWLRYLFKCPANQIFNDTLKQCVDQ